MGVGAVGFDPGKPPGFCDFVASGPPCDHAGESGMQRPSGRQIMDRVRRDVPGHACVRLHSACPDTVIDEDRGRSAENPAKDCSPLLLSVCMPKPAVGTTKSQNAIPFKTGFTGVDIANLILSKFE